MYYILINIYIYINIKFKKNYFSLICWGSDVQAVICFLEAPLFNIFKFMHLFLKYICTWLNIFNLENNKLKNDLQMKKKNINGQQLIIKNKKTEKLNKYCLKKYLKEEN